ncbi:hypothetical protein ACEYYH_12265 [Microbacterium trichothecenolyticum]|uniref:hypothetical protein n=1 Tax=Microbacterium trichothecenolyticum TaxID=69370 RepID=UPI0035BE57B2
MKMSRLTIAALTIAGCLTALSAAGANAAPTEDRVEPSLPSFLAPIDPADVPAELRTDAPDPEFQTPASVPPGVSDALITMELENPELGIAGTEWDPVTQTTLLYATAPAQAVVSVLEKHGIAHQVAYRAARYDAASMRGIIREVIGGEDGRLPSGHSVVMAAPALDGSRIDLVLEDSSQMLRAAPAIPDVGIPVAVEYGAALTPTLRNHEPSISPGQRYSGAYMHNGSTACTTGFRVTQPSSSTPGMASAEHCSTTAAIGTQWYYNSTLGHFIGQAQGQMMPPGPGYRPDLASWTGGGAGALVPGIFIGDNTVAGSGVYAIKGAASTPVGAYVCYSGSRSGTICGNTVTNINVTACYGAPYGCYDNITVTSQVSGTPSAGQGDSGGPAYNTNSGNIYAAGFISGISNGTTTCSGDAGGRLCSSVVLFSVINDVFVAGWALNVIP